LYYRAVTSTEAPLDLPLGRRERKNRQTRLAIVQATVDLVLEGGYAAATIPKIAERADVSPRTVSTWFPAKDDILFDRVDAAVARAVTHLRTGGGDVMDRIQAWLTGEAGQGHADAETAQLRERAIKHDPELRARAHRHFDELQSEIAAAVARDLGGSPDDSGPQVVAGAAMAYLFTLRAVRQDGRSKTSRRADDDGIRFLRAGLAGITKGRR
jgi:AcrR family transcriptional regulator